MRAGLPPHPRRERGQENDPGAPPALCRVLVTSTQQPGKWRLEEEKVIIRTKGHPGKSWGSQAPHMASSSCSMKGLAHLGFPFPHSYPPMGPGCPCQPERGQASALQPSVQGPSCQGQRGWRGARPWTRTQEPPGGRCLLQQTATNNRCARAPAGRATRRPTPRSSESQTGSNGVGRGRTTPDTLKVKTSHVMPHGEGTGFLSALLQSLHSDLTSCHTSKVLAPHPLPPTQVLTPILGTATTPGFIYVIS